MDRKKVEALREQAIQFALLELPGQPQMMHVGTANLVSDLDRVAKAYLDLIAHLQGEAVVAKLNAAVESALAATPAVDASQSQIRRLHAEAIARAALSVILEEMGGPDE